MTEVITQIYHINSPPKNWDHIAWHSGKYRPVSNKEGATLYGSEIGGVPFLLCDEGRTIMIDGLKDRKPEVISKIEETLRYNRIEDELKRIK